MFWVFYTWLKRVTQADIFMKSLFQHRCTLRRVKQSCFHLQNLQWRNITSFSDPGFSRLGEKQGHLLAENAQMILRQWGSESGCVPSELRRMVVSFCISCRMLRHFIFNLSHLSSSLCMSRGPSLSGHQLTKYLKRYFQFKIVSSLLFRDVIRLARDPGLWFFPSVSSTLLNH